MEITNKPSVVSMLQLLRDRADHADHDPAWPADSWQALTSAGVPAWSIPRAFGGRELGPVDLLKGYESLASACLTTAFILSQREAAVRRIVGLSGPAQQQRLLPKLATGEIFMTVGLSQLTTSRQHGAPSLTATPLDGGRFRLHGLIPWVTAADQAQEIVIGATLPDGQQILALLPGKAAGVSIDAPLSLMALAGSRTTQIRCDNVTIEPEQLVAGPASQVAAVGKGGVGGLETSCLAAGSGERRHCLSGRRSGKSGPIWLRAQHDSWPPPNDCVSSCSVSPKSKRFLPR